MQLFRKRYSLTEGIEEQQFIWQFPENKQKTNQQFENLSFAIFKLC